MTGGKDETDLAAGFVFNKGISSYSPVDILISKNASLRSLERSKVQITEGASLYAFCRLWLTNGHYEQSQPHSDNGMKLPPRPLSLYLAEHQVERESCIKENKEEEGEDDEPFNSIQDLLQIHVKRAKRTRARFRDERLNRISKYKTRLAALLHPQLDQQQQSSPFS